jgi:uncharacterized protein YdcH (DUF465 family)
MGRLSQHARHRNEAAIRAATDRLLRGEIPPGGRCDLQTLAAEAGVTRTGFYPKGQRPGPYQHLAEEFEQRRNALHQSGDNPDPRAAQIDRLKQENAHLKDRLAERDATIDELTAFKTTAASRLAAQHDEIEHLRRTAGPPPARVHSLPATGRAPIIGPC